MDPILLIPLLIVMALAAFHRVSHSRCNTTLKALRDGLKLSLTLDGAKMDARKQKLLDAFLSDVRTVKKRFSLSAEMVTYAACPGCDKIFAPRVENGIDHYPLACDRKIGASSQICRRKLTVPGVLGDGQTIHVPVKPYAVQQFNSFKARLLNTIRCHFLYKPLRETKHPCQIL